MSDPQDVERRLREIEAEIAAATDVVEALRTAITVAAAATPDELKGVWPSILGPKPYGGV